MATLSTSNSRYRIQFFDKDGRRRSVSIGKMPKKSAHSIRTRIDDLEAALISGRSPSRETSSWLSELGQTMKEKLANVGLIEQPDASSLKAFIQSYIDSRTDLKDATITQIRLAGDSLCKVLGDDKPLRDVTEADAERWRMSMLESGLADNTVRRRCGRAKQIFRVAIKGRLIERNPFSELKTAVTANAERFEFISTETVEKVIEAAPDAEWRLLIALARYGGLRTPSEPLSLRWSDIDWERQRIRVPSPKTEHHAGKGSRTIPIFPELKTHLDAVWELLGDKEAEFVITRYRDAASNLRTQFERIIKKAGVESWGKPWQNMRASRETELTKDYPLHVVTSWMGNSQPVAMKHYLHVLDSDFERAANKPTAGDEKSVHPAVQRGAANSGKPQKHCTAKPVKARGTLQWQSESDTRNCPTRTRT